MASFKDTLPSTPKASVPSTPDLSLSASASTTPALPPKAVSTPPKKTVRFADEPQPEDRPRDSILYHAFQHLAAQEKPRDAFIHRHARINALRLQRSYMKEQHRARLNGSFDLNAAVQQKQSWLHANAKADADEIARRETLANAGKEQRALQQLSLTSWMLQATSFLNGGSLLPQSTIDILTAELNTGNQARVLDFGGQPTAGWGWALATSQRDLKIYTAVPTRTGIKSDWLTHRGPSNHRIASVPDPWCLPFPTGFFHVISARTLHTLLRTNSFPLRDEPSVDEFEATLRELYRVLAPGGMMHFSLMDAEVSAPANSSLAARSIEFAVALRTRGYDACAGRHIASRLEKAGFSDVKKSWVSLPWVSKGETDGDKRSDGGASVPSQGMDTITGLVGSVAWEQWMLKFQTDTGKTGDALLAGVAEALDEARSAQESTVSWSMLVGCAQKA